MSSYDREYVDRVLAELEGDLGFAAARQRLLFALTWRAREVRSPGFRFVRLIDGLLLDRLHPLRSSSFASRRRLVTEIPPYGWRAEYECDRDVLGVMPAWFYYPRRWWRRAQSWWYWRGR